MIKTRILFSICESKEYAIKAIRQGGETDAVAFGLHLMEINYCITIREPQIFPLPLDGGGPGWG